MKLNGDNKNRWRILLSSISTISTGFWMRFGHRRKQNTCPNENPLVQGFGTGFCFACTNSHPNR